MTTATNEAPPRPTALSVNPDGVPAELKGLSQWILWRYEWSVEKGQWDKPPRRPSGADAQRLAKRFGAEFRWCEQWEKHLVWDNYVRIGAKTISRNSVR